MTRGSTPTFIFTLPADASAFPEIEIVFMQDGTDVLTVEKPRLIARGNEVSFRMTEAETLLFTPSVNAELQMRLAGTDGTVLVSSIRKIPVRKKYPEDGEDENEP